MPFECLLPVHIPAIIELTSVLVGPFLEYVVWRVGGAGRVVQHPRLGGILGPHGVQPLDSLVGEVVGEIVGTAVFPRTLGYAYDGVVLTDDRVVLTRGAAREAPEMVESPTSGQLSNGPAAPWTLSGVRCHLPKAPVT